jgi:hypothetical protein
VKEKLEEINIRLREKDTKYYFLVDWVINPLIEEDMVKTQVAKKGSDKILTQRKAEKAEKKAKKKAVANKKKVDNEVVVVVVAAKKKVDNEVVTVVVVAKKKVDDKVVVVAVVAKKKVDNKAIVVAVAKKFGNIEFPWIIYPFPTGERIIAGR